MGNNNYKHGNLTLAAAFLAPLLVCSLPAQALDQSSAQDEARRVHDDGSDDSLKHSYKNALHAVDNFYQLNIPGAITYGVKAYGQYKNSEQLDDLKAKNKNLENSMSSVGSSQVAGQENAGGPEGGTMGPMRNPVRLGSAEGGSPFLRIDPAFLREGETGRIAGKIEKLTGLSREKMFKMAVDLHSNNMQRSVKDADFVSQAKKAYRDFLQKMPNEEFRESVKKAEDIASLSPVQAVLAKLQPGESGAAPELLAAAPESPMQSETKSEEASEEMAADSAGANTVASDSSPSRAPAAQAGSAHPTGLDRLKFDPVDGYLGELIKTQSKENDRQNSIFRVVSSKIKEMTFRQNLERKPVLQTVAQGNLP